jgi:hypothetical protein
LGSHNVDVASSLNGRYLARQGDIEHTMDDSTYYAQPNGSQPVHATMDDGAYYAERMRHFVQVSQSFREFLVEFEELLEATSQRIDRGEDVFSGDGAPSGTGVVMERINNQSASVYRDRFFGLMSAIDLAHNRIRAECARRLIDDQGWNLTRTAEASGRSRQFTTRLYRLGQQWRKEATES